MDGKNQPNALSLFVVLMLLSALLSRSYSSGSAVSAVSPPEGFGPNPAGWINVEVPEAGGGTLALAVYYPSTAFAQDASPNATCAPYPTVFFSPGFEATLDYYRLVAAEIASWGFVFTIVGSPPGVWDTERISDLADAKNWLEAQNENSSFKLSQMIDESKLGVMGHSLGGDAAIMFSASEVGLKVLIAVAPFISSPITQASVETSSNIHIPTCILVGSADTIAPPNSMAYPFYNNGNTPKFCVTMMGDDHLSITLSCIRYAVSFLKLCLDGDQDYARYLYGSVAQQQASDGAINLRYDLRKTLRYEALSNGTVYNVSVYSDSTFLSFLFNETNNQMDFTLTGPPDTTGSANVSIPTQLVGGFNITVLFDDETYPASITGNTAFYNVYLAYNHSLHRLTVDFFDVTPPIVSIVTPAADFLTDSSNVTLSWNGEDTASGLDHFEVRIDAQGWIDVGEATYYSFEGLSDGRHAAYVEAFDKAGNAQTVQVHFGVDTTPPSVWIVSPTSGTVTNSSTVAVNWIGTDATSGIDHYEVRLDDGDWINVGNSESHAFANASNGNHVIQVDAVDKAGNTFSVQTVFTVQFSQDTNLLPNQRQLLTAVATVAVVLVIVTFYARNKKRLRRQADDSISNVDIQ